MEIKFSIIIPVYNGELYIKKCLESILNQSYTNYEIIIINDGSTDNTSKELCEIKNAKINIIEIENSGPSIARNKGVEFAKGDYIIFIDIDDTTNKDLLFNIFNVLQEKKYDMVRYQANEIEKEIAVSKNLFITEAFSEKTGREALLHLINKNEIFGPVWLYAFKTSFLKENNLYFEPNILQEDFRILPLALMKAKHVRCIDYLGYNYHLTENSIMRNNNYDGEVLKAFNMIDNYKFLLSNVVEALLSEEEQYKVKIYLYKAVFRKIRYLKPDDKEEFIKELKKLGEIYMYDTKEFFENIFDQAIQLKEDFKVAEKKEWDALTVLLELTVQMAQLEFIVANNNEYEEVGRKIDNKGDEIADVLLQLSALSNKLSISPELLNVEYKFISYEDERCYLSNLFILLGQLTEAVMEYEEYRFDKGRIGFNTKIEFIIDRIRKMYELTFSVAVKSNIDFNQEFLLMIEDATGFLNRYKKEHGIE